MKSALCRVHPRAALAPLLDARASTWRELMLRLGVRVPRFLVRDLGALWTTPRAERHIGPPPDEAGPGARVEPRARKPAGEAAWLADATERSLLQHYQALLSQLADSDAVTQVAALRLRDEVVAALLARLLAELATRFAAVPENAALLLPPRDTLDETGLAFLRFLFDGKQPLHLLTAVELVDAGALQLLSLRSQRDGTEPDAGPGVLGLVPDGGLDLLDLYGALSAPDARDIARFALDLIPAVLETPQSAGAQTYPTGGYASIERRGSLDALLPGELASDEDLFLARLADGDLNYYAFERQRPPEELERRLHCVLIDASPSMRGLRQVFARGLGLALAKKLGLLGGEVWLRFFDARLHEPLKVPSQRGPALTGAARGEAERLVPYVLGFRAQRGRNYRRVFAELLEDVTTQVKKRRRQVQLYFITHAECHVDVGIIQSLTQLCRTCGVFMLPSGELSLEYLTLLHRHHVIRDTTLRATGERRSRALEIVADAARETPTLGTLGTTPRPTLFR